MILRRLLVALAIAVSLLAVNTARVQYSMVNSSGTLPTCTGSGGIYVKTGASSGLYWCLSGVWGGPAGTGSTGDVTGPGSSTDNAVTRFDSTTGKVIQNSAVTLDDNGVFTFPDGQRQTFNPDGTNAGVNVGSQSGDPSGPSNGDLWYDSSANELTARINGANVALGAGGTGKLAQFVASTANGVNTGSTNMPADDTIPQNTEGDEYMTVSITPTNASSTLLVHVNALLSPNTNRQMSGAIFRDSTADAICATVSSVNANQVMTTMSFECTTSAGSTSATTFKFRAGWTFSTSVTITFNGFNSGRVFGTAPKSMMWVKEILP